MKTRALGHLIAFSLAVATAGCGDEAPFSNDNGDLYSLNQDLLFSGRFTAKVPVVDFPIDAEVIPVGEGQWDYEAWLEAGASFWPIPAYGVLWLGHRWRATNNATTRDPGDEYAFLAELGGTLKGSLGGKVVIDAIFGGNGSIRGVNVSSDEREIVYLQPTINFQVTPAFLLEAAIRVPLHGRNFPAGNQFMIGVFYRPVAGG
jgi:hypothetical protein